MFLYAGEVAPQSGFVKLDDVCEADPKGRIWRSSGPAVWLAARRGLADLIEVRDTLYELVKVYASATDEDDSPLDHVADPEARFGSYRRLASSGEFRFLHPERSETPHR